MEHLKEKLTGLVRELEKEKHDQVMQRLDDLVSFYPFNEYEFLISSLMGYGKITIDDYYELRDDYIARNLYMYVFEISAPRGFGEGRVSEPLLLAHRALRGVTDCLTGNLTRAARGDNPLT